MTAMLLVAEASLPLLAVASLVSAAVSSAVTGTLAVVGFLRRQRDNARAIAAQNLLLYGDPKTGEAGIIKAMKELESWKRLTNGKISAIKKSFEDDVDHLVHKLWPT